MFALPFLNADTIAFAPVSSVETREMGRRSVPAGLTGALRRGRVAARELTTQWLLQFPDSPEGWFQHAVALELGGQIVSRGDGSSADDALDRVEAGTPSPAMRARIGVARTRLALRRGDVKRAVELSQRATAGGLASTSDVQAILAPLAAFLGDVPLATRLSGSDRANASALPPAVADSLRTFSLRAMLSSCEGLAATRLDLERLFRGSIAKDELQAQRVAWLLPAYRLAVPCLGPTTLSDFSPLLPLDFAYQALAAGNAAEAQRRLADVRASRSGATLAAISWDYLFAESAALVSASDSAAARMQLAGALDDIASMSMYTLDEMAQAAGLRRGILLMAELARLNVRGPGSEGAWVTRARELPATTKHEKRK